MARTKENVNFEGVGATLNVWNIPVVASQYTSGRIKISNGAESLEAGWMVIAQKILLISIQTQTHMFGLFNKCFILYLFILCFR